MVIFSQREKQSLSLVIITSYVAHTPDKNWFLGLAGTVVTSRHGRLQGKNIRDFLLVWQILVLCQSLPFWMLLSSTPGCFCSDVLIPPVRFSNVDVHCWRQWKRRGDSAQTHTLTHRSAVPVAPLRSPALSPDCTGDSLQYTFYESLIYSTALVLSLGCWRGWGVMALFHLLPLTDHFRCRHLFVCTLHLYIDFELKSPDFRSVS